MKKYRKTRSHEERTDLWPPNNYSLYEFLICVSNNGQTYRCALLLLAGQRWHVCMALDSRESAFKTIEIIQNLIAIASNAVNTSLVELHCSFLMHLEMQSSRCQVETAARRHGIRFRLKGTRRMCLFSLNVTEHCFCVSTCNGTGHKAFVHPLYATS